MELLEKTLTLRPIGEDLVRGESIPDEIDLEIGSVHEFRVNGEFIFSEGDVARLQVLDRKLNAPVDIGEVRILNSSYFIGRTWGRYEVIKIYEHNS